MSQVYTEIYKIIQRIPKGRVLTYGLISHMIGGRMSAQGVGWALKALGSVKPVGRSSKKSIAKVPYSMNTVPWHRVVNAMGGTSTHKIGILPPRLQQDLLESEGVIFDNEGKTDLKKYLWIEGVTR